MPQGLQVWDASGNLIGDVTDYYGRVTNVVDIPASTSSSTTISVPASGTQTQMLLPTSGTFTPGDVTDAPTISIVGTTLSYTNSSAKGFKLIMGVW